MQRTEVGDLVARCATIAALLEVSAYPKPGNVHRTHDFPGTRYEHFLAGSVAMNPAIRELALRGYDASGGLNGWRCIEVGNLVLEATTETLSWQRGGNVNLGVVLLFAPIAAAGGAVLCENSGVNVRTLREKLKKVLHATTPDDAIKVYNAIQRAMTPIALREVKELDVYNDSSLIRIQDEGLNLMDIFRICSERDSICREWISDFEITFEYGYSYLKRSLEESNNINSATVNTFLFLLSRQPDSLIRRKRGIKKATEVSDKAKMILKEGGSSSEKGRELLRQLDWELQKAGGALNPGTTADLTAASLFVALLEGWRP